MPTQTNQDTLSLTIGQLAARWAEADKGVLRPVFRLLAEGQPVSVERISKVTGATRSTVEAALAAGRAGRDAQGHVVELAGFTLSPTMHRVMIGDVAMFSCCALLAHLVPELLGRPVTVESIDPVSRRIVSLVVTPAGVAKVEPEDAVGSFVLTDAQDVKRDVAAAFCRHVNHFASRDSAKAFGEAEPRRYAITIGQLHGAAAMLYRQAWAAGP